MIAYVFQFHNAAHSGSFCCSDIRMLRKHTSVVWGPLQNTLRERVVYNSDNIKIYALSIFSRLFEDCLRVNGVGLLRAYLGFFARGC
jgi:hypothetical protein